MSAPLSKIDSQCQLEDERIVVIAGKVNLRLAELIPVLGEHIQIKVYDQLIVGSELVWGTQNYIDLEIEFCRDFPTLDRFGTAYLEEFTHALCKAAEIELPHDKQVLIAQGLWPAVRALMEAQ